LQPGKIKYNVKDEHIVRGGNFIIRGTIATSLRKIASTLYIESFFLNTVSKMLSVGVKKLRKDKIEHFIYFYYWLLLQFLSGQLSSLPGT
jgi:hypothetical protein